MTCAHHGPTAVVTMFLVFMLSVFSFPAGADTVSSDKNLSNRAMSPTRGDSVDEKQDRSLLRKSVLVWNFSVITQLVSLSLPVAFCEAHEYADRAVLTSFGLYSAITPALSASISRAVVTEKGTLSAMVVGGYVGAMVSFASIMPIVLRDNPHADGTYDGNFFNRGDKEVYAGFFLLGVLPVILPSLFTTLAFVYYKRSSRHQGDVRFEPPTVSILEKHGPSGTVRELRLRLISASF